MSNNSLINSLQHNQELAYNYDSISNDETSLYESSDKAYSDGFEINYKEMADEEIISLYIDNEDESAFNEIVDRYGWKLHRLAFRITHDMRNADDVLQDVFLTLVEKLQTFRQQSKFSTWLYRVAVNASFMFLKRQKKYQRELSLDDFETYDNNGYLEGVVLQDWSCVPEDVVMRREEMDKIEKAISELPELHRVAFHLSHIEGLTNAEIGNILGLTLPAVKSRVRRARMFLRDRLSDNLYN
ncbi:MAG: sigma-70 family RNA polymerase sigma factor [Deltaproteobacteria bacterium]